MKKPMAKKVLAAVTAAAMTMSLAACGGLKRNLHLQRLQMKQ